VKILETGFGRIKKINFVFCGNIRK